MRIGHQFAGCGHAVGIEYQPAVLELTDSGFSVAAKFKTASGMELRGIVGVNTMGSLEVIHAAVITEDNYVFIPWPGYPGARRSCQVASRELGISESDLFPLKYELLVPIEGVRETVHGEYAYGDA
jgi:hypothetical protein